MLVLPLAVVVGGLWWYLTSGRYVSTDDAYVQAGMVPVSADVDGRIVEVLVHDNQPVKAGQVLFRLDDRPYIIAVERAESRLASARLQVESLRASYHQRMAELKAAQDTLAYRQRELQRQRNLLTTHTSPQSAVDQAANAAEVAREQVVAIQQQIASILASLGGDPDIPTDQHPTVREAQAALDQAQLDLTHTVVTAPVNGIVAQVDKVPVGTYLTAGSPAFSLVATDALWVEANFKETQLTYVRPGQEATVTVDAYPGTVFRAHVDSLSPGTGAQFSVLPPQNASGNWVKVVQRLPVRLVIDNPDPDKPLRAGMTVTAEVDTRHQSSLLAELRGLFGTRSAAASR
ncbi:MAG: HlyD family secretion protein [Rhodospirillaceae bacterium]|nr:HlyD family secretion protein [Rhodospirillaceae bacterium]